MMTLLFWIFCTVLLAVFLFILRRDIKGLDQDSVDAAVMGLSFWAIACTLIAVILMGIVRARSNPEYWVVQNTETGEFAIRGERVDWGPFRGYRVKEVLGSRRFSSFDSAYGFLTESGNQKECGGTWVRCYPIDKSNGK